MNVWLPFKKVGIPLEVTTINGYIYIKYGSQHTMKTI